MVLSIRESGRLRGKEGDHHDGWRHAGQALRCLFSRQELLCRRRLPGCLLRLPQSSPGGGGCSGLHGSGVASGGAPVRLRRVVRATQGVFVRIAARWNPRPVSNLVTARLATSLAEPLWLGEGREGIPVLPNAGSVSPKYVVLGGVTGSLRLVVVGLDGAYVGGAKLMSSRGFIS